MLVTNLNMILKNLIQQQPLENIDFENWAALLCSSEDINLLSTHATNRVDPLTIDIAIWQYWFWYWFIFLWCVFFFIVIHTYSRKTDNTNVVINTSLRSHGKWGDFLFSLIPILWCFSILIHSNTLLHLMELQTQASLFTIRVCGRQWSWMYYFSNSARSEGANLYYNVGYSNQACVNTDSANKRLTAQNYLTNVLHNEEFMASRELSNFSEFSSNNFELFNLQHNQKLQYLFNKTNYFHSLNTIKHPRSIFWSKRLTNLKTRYILDDIFLVNNRFSRDYSFNFKNFKNVLSSKLKHKILNNIHIRLNFLSQTPKNPSTKSQNPYTSVKIISSFVSTYKMSIERLNVWNHNCKSNEHNLNDKWSLNYLINSIKFTRFFNLYFLNKEFMLIHFFKTTNKFYDNLRIKFFKKQSNTILQSYKNILRLKYSNFSKFRVEASNLFYTDNSDNSLDYGLLNQCSTSISLKKCILTNEKLATFKYKKLDNIELFHLKLFNSATNADKIDNKLDAGLIFTTQERHLYAATLEDKYPLDNLEDSAGQELNYRYIFRPFLEIKTLDTISNNAKNKEHLLINTNLGKKLKTWKLKFSKHNYEKLNKPIKKVNTNALAQKFIKWSFGRSIFKRGIVKGQSKICLNTRLNFLVSKNQKLLFKKYFFASLEKLLVNNKIIRFNKIKLPANKFVKTDFFVALQTKLKFNSKKYSIFGDKYFLKFRERVYQRKVLLQQSKKINYKLFEKKLVKKTSRDIYKESKIRANLYTAGVSVDLRRIMNSYTNSKQSPKFLKIFMYNHYFHLAKNLDFIKFLSLYVNMSKLVVKDSLVSTSTQVASKLNIKSTMKQLFFNNDKFLSYKVNPVDNNLKNFKFQTKQSQRLLKTQNVLVLPCRVTMTLLTTSYDVIHSWFIPGLGLKFDCIPGRATRHSLRIDTPGLYFGQCAEICGRYHHHMPIRICAIPFNQFIVWWDHRYREFVPSYDKELE